MSSGNKFTDPRWASQVTEEMKAAVRAKAIDGKITCAVLRTYAEEAGVPYKVAGAAADAAGVRVYNCDLGCF
jgi:hypothetical protein